MQQVSERFLAAVDDSPTVVSYADVYHGLELVKAGLSIESGDLTIDSTATVRRTLRATAIDVDGDLVPGAAATDEILDETRAEVHVRSGFRFADGSEELQPCGVFRPRSTSRAADGGVTIEIDGYDRSVACQTNLAHAWAIPAGEAVEAEAARLLTEVLPGLTVRSVETGFTTPALLLPEGSDPWGEATQLVTAAGCELSIDRLGDGEIAPATVAASQARVVRFVAGENQFWNPKVSRTVDDLYNVVVVVGSHSSTSGIRAVAADTDPSSRTYYRGPFGARVWIERSERVSSQPQADAMANALLVRKLGPAETITLECPPNAAIDEGDTMLVHHEPLGIYQRFGVIEKIGLPFGADRMTLSARKSILTGLEDALTGLGVAP